MPRDKSLFDQMLLAVSLVPVLGVAKVLLSDGGFENLIILGGLAWIWMTGAAVLLLRALYTLLAPLLKGEGVTALWLLQLKFQGLAVLVYALTYAVAARIPIDGP